MTRKSKLESTSRKEIFRQVGKLYDVRSKIVHSGSYQVTDDELSLMWEYAKRSIVRIIISTPFTDMSSPQQLAAWFQDRMLE